MRRSSPILPGLSLGCFLCVALGGCSLSRTGAPTVEAGAAIRGRVFGGQAPVVGGHVYLFQANTTGYAGPGISPSASNVSLSLLTPGPGRALDANGYYVTSDSGGNWVITGDYACTPGKQVYVYSLGGDAGSGNNPYAGMMAALGSCPSGDSFSGSLFVILNEVSTIAAAYAFAGFATDATHVSSSGTALAQTGMQNAFANAANMETLTTGVALAVTPAGNGLVPQSEINMLGNILASCVNSSGAFIGGTSPTPCYTLLTDAESGGSSGILPLDTATAAINMAHNPGANIAALYALSTATPPFASALTGAPNDFTIALKFVGGGLNNPSSVAIDGFGDAWIANNTSPAGSVTEFSNTGIALNTSPLVGGGLQTPSGIAIDTGGNVWISNNYNPGSITELDGSSGAVIAGSPFTGGGLNEPYGIAVDASNNIWTANFGQGFAGSASKFSNGGTPDSGSRGYGTGMGIDTGIAIDPSGNAWTADLYIGSLDEVNNTGTLESGFTGYGSLTSPAGLAFDANSHVWVATHGNNVKVLNDTGGAVGTYTGGGLGMSQGIAIDGAGSAWVVNTSSSLTVAGLLSEFSSSGTALTPSTGFTMASMINPTGIAIDGSGNVWVPNSGNSTVTEFIGAATPVVTPLAVGVQNNTLGTRP